MAAVGRSVVGTVLVLVSIAVFAVGWRLTELDRFFLLHAAQTTGTVVAHESYLREARKVQERFRLVVAFEAPDGQRVRFRSQTTYGRPPYPVGERVPVRFDPDRPHRARVDRPVEFVAPVVIWVGAVLLLGSLGVAIAVYGPRDARGTSQRA